MHTEIIAVEAHFAKILQEKELDGFLGTDSSGHKGRVPPSSVAASDDTVRHQGHGHSLMCAHRVVIKGRYLNTKGKGKLRTEMAGALNQGRHRLICRRGEGLPASGRFESSTLSNID